MENEIKEKMQKTIDKILELNDEGLRDLYQKWADDVELELGYEAEEEMLEKIMRENNCSKLEAYTILRRLLEEEEEEDDGRTEND